MNSKRLLVTVGSILLIVVLAMSLVLMACAKETAPTTSSPTSPAATTPTTTTPAATKPAATTPVPTKPAPQPSAEVIKWRATLHIAAGSKLYEFHKNILPKMLSERTNGRIVLENIHAAGELVAADQALEACANGMVNFVEGSPSYWKGAIPVSEVMAGLPMTYRHPMENYMLLWDRGLGDIIVQEYAKKNVRWLTPLPYARTTLVTKKKITSLDAFKGTKVVTYGPWMALMDKIGASGVYIVLAERYTALATGVADAALTTPSWMFDNKFYELCPYMVQPDFCFGPGDEYFMNLNDWNKLPTDLQQSLTAAMRETAFAFTRFMFWQEYTATTNWMAKAKGGEVVNWSNADMAKIVTQAQIYWDEVAAKDPASAKGVALLKQMLKDLGYMN